MSLVIKCVGSIAATGLLIVSGWMNFRFGQSLGQDVVDGWFFGIASGCADGMKAILPFVIVAAWRSIRLVGMLAALALWVLCSAYSLTSSLGFAAMNRSHATDAKRLDAQRFVQLQQVISHKQGELQALGSQRAAGAIHSEMLSARQQRRWTSTNGCTDATARQSRIFCQRYFAMKAEHASSVRARKLEQSIEGLRKELNGWQGFAGKSPDPQVSVIDQIVGLGEDRVTLALTILLSAMLELGSGLGFFLLFDRRPQHDDAVVTIDDAGPVILKPVEDTPVADDDWLRERLRSDKSASMPIARLYEDYLRWCEQKAHRDAMSFAVFSKWIFERLQIDGKKVGGSVNAQGVRLAA